MKKFLQQIRLIDHLTVILPVSRSVFVHKLSAIVEKGNASPHSGDVANTFDKKEWFGSVDMYGYKVRKKKRMFEQRNEAVATGTFTEVNGQLLIETEIRGFVIRTFIVQLIFITALIFLAAIFPQTGGDKNPFALTGILIFIIILIFGPYFFARRNVARLKYELERELFYLAKDNAQ